MFQRNSFSLFLISNRYLQTTSQSWARNIKPWKIGLEGEYRKARAKKVLKIELPDFEKLRSEDRLSAEEYVSRLKEKGIAPPKSYKEKPILVATTQGVLDPYVPPEGDGLFSILSKKGASQKATHVKQRTSSFMAVRKIKSYEDEFDLPTFAEEALQIYIKAHKLLASGATDELLDYVTEFAYPIMTFQRDQRTIRWTFIENIDQPSVVQVRTQHLIEKTNMFAQITIRFNSKQILAIYDRFGHLMYGSEAVVKNVVEYVVFEKNISDYNGKWRLHSKIIPEWLPKKPPILNTFVRDKPPEPPTEEELRFEREGILSDERKEEEKKPEDTPQTALVQ